MKKNIKKTVLSIVSAIRYLEENSLAENVVISLQLFGEEGYQLQSAMKHEFEGATSLGLHPLLKEVGYEANLGNAQFNVLLNEIGRADLAIQFINSYPARNDGDNDGDLLNLKVYIMRKETLWEVLRQFDPLDDTPRSRYVSPAPVLNDFKGIRKNSRKPSRGISTVSRATT